MKKRVKLWIKEVEKPENAEPKLKAGKKDGHLHNLWAVQNTKIKELEAMNKNLKLKQKMKKLKGSGGTVPTSAVGRMMRRLLFNWSRMERSGRWSLRGWLWRSRMLPLWHTERSRDDL